jgi:hypothetical protein
MYEDEDDSLETDEIQEGELDRGDDEPEGECDEADNDCETGDVVEEMAGVLGEQAEESEERECEEEVEAEVEEEAEREKEDRVEEEAADDEGENPDSARAMSGEQAMAASTSGFPMTSPGHNARHGSRQTLRGWIPGALGRGS